MVLNYSKKWQIYEKVLVESLSKSLFKITFITKKLKSFELANGIWDIGVPYSKLRLGMLGLILGLLTSMRSPFRYKFLGCQLKE